MVNVHVMPMPSHRHIVLVLVQLAVLEAVAIERLW